MKAPSSQRAARRPSRRVSGDDPALPVDGQRRRVNTPGHRGDGRRARRRCPSPTTKEPLAEDPLAADGRCVVEAPVATARAISEEEAVEERSRRSLYHRQ